MWAFLPILASSVSFLAQKVLLPNLFKLLHFSYICISYASEVPTCRPENSSEKSSSNLQLNVSKIRLTKQIDHILEFSVLVKDLLSQLPRLNFLPFRFYQVTHLNVSFLCYWSGFLTLPPIWKHLSIASSMCQRLGIFGHETCRNFTK